MIRPAVAFLVFLAVSPSSAAVLTGPVVNPANGNSYYLLEGASWTDSQAEAETLGGNLVTINDHAENDWVFGNFWFFGGEARNLWIGYTDEATEGDFVWASGEQSTFTNWGLSEPNNSDGFEHYAYMVATSPQSIAPGFWNDQRNLWILEPSGVVEVVVPEPSSIALAVVSTFAFYFIRSR